MSTSDSIQGSRVAHFLKPHLPADRHIQLNIKTEKNWTEAATRRFIDTLCTKSGKWHEIMSQPDVVTDPVDIVKKDKTGCRIYTENNACYRFVKNSGLKVKHISEVMLFTNINTATSFLRMLTADNDSLATLINDFEIALPFCDYTNSGQKLSALAQQLTSGNIIVLVERTTATLARRDSGKNTSI